MGYPYIDLYIGRNISSFTGEGDWNASLIREKAARLKLTKEGDEKVFDQFAGCQHFYGDVFPTRKVLVYGNSFSQNFPANTEQILRTVYGTDWRTPLANKNPDGTKCRNDEY